MVPKTAPVKLIGLLVSPAQRTTFGVTFTSGLGFTDTTTSKGKPAQPLDKGMILYVAVWTLVVGLVNVPDIVVSFVPIVPPVMPPVTTGAIQE